MSNDTMTWPCAIDDATRALIVDFADRAGQRCVARVARAATTCEEWADVSRDLHADLGTRPHDSGHRERLTWAMHTARAIERDDEGRCTIRAPYSPPGG